MVGRPRSKSPAAHHNNNGNNNNNNNNSSSSRSRSRKNAIMMSNASSSSSSVSSSMNDDDDDDDDDDDMDDVQQDNFKHENLGITNRHKKTLGNSILSSGKTDNHASEGLTGVTLDGKIRFNVPEPPSTLDELKKWNSIPSLVTMVCFIISIVVALPQFSRTDIFLISIFWRLAYNVGIGYMLHQQSQTQFITKWVEKISKEKKDSRKRKFLSNLVDSTMGEGHNCLVDDKLPPAYTAWMLARFVINVILPNDVLAFVLVAFRYVSFATGDECDWHSSICIPPYIAYSFGIILILFGIWSKISAHHVIGAYCWFWGDFFFRAEQELTFDGVFELVPHPMYTIGYSWIYGGALITRSHHVLALALFSHIAQMLFCGLVETPHIEKIYGDSGGSGSRQGRTNIFIVKNFDPFQSSDISLVIVTVLYILLLSIGSQPGGLLDSDQFFINQAVVMRITTQLIVALILVRQDQTKFWTKHFENQEQSHHEAFSNFKRLYNLLATLQHVAFLACAIRLAYLPDVEVLISGSYATQVIVGVLLMGLSHWSFESCYQVLGDFGWFYGDFFIERTPDQQLTYTGIYRYMNNPDTYLGNLWLYGIALVCYRWELFAIAILGQSMSILFLQLVEKPRLKVIYQNHKPYGSAVGRKLVDQTKKSQENAKILRSKMESKVKELRQKAEMAAQKLKEKAERRINLLIQRMRTGSMDDDDDDEEE